MQERENVEITKLNFIKSKLKDESDILRTLSNIYYFIIRISHIIHKNCMD